MKRHTLSSRFTAQPTIAPAVNSAQAFERRRREITAAIDDATDRQARAISVDDLRQCAAKIDALRGEDAVLVRKLASARQVDGAAVAARKAAVEDHEAIVDAELVLAVQPYVSTIEGAIREIRNLRIEARKAGAPAAVEPEQWSEVRQFRERDGLFYALDSLLDGALVVWHGVRLPAAEDRVRSARKRR